MGVRVGWVLGVLVGVTVVDSAWADDKEKDRNPPPPVMRLPVCAQPAAPSQPSTAPFALMLRDTADGSTPQSRARFQSRVLPLGNVSPGEFMAVREYLGASVNDTTVINGADAETSMLRAQLNAADPTIPKGTSFVKINNTLRGRALKNPLGAADAQYVKDVTGLLDRAFTRQTTQAPLTTYRFTGDGPYMQPGADGILTDKGFVSTARVPAAQFGGPGKVLVVYNIPAGQPAINMEGVLKLSGDAAQFEGRMAKPGAPGETVFGRDEVLLPRDTKVKVRSVYVDPSGQKIMQVDVLPSEGAPKLAVARNPMNVVKGAPNAILGAALGKVVEHETGSQSAGVVTSVGVGIAPAVLANGVKGLKGIGPAVVGAGVQYGVTRATGNQQAGEVSGYLTSAAFGAGAGGPLGAVAAVAIHGGSNLAAAGVDVLYADMESRDIDRNMVGTIYATTVGGRIPNDLKSKYYDDVRNGAKYQDIKRAIADSPNADATIDELFMTTLGRKPISDEERNAARDVLRERNKFILEAALRLTPQAEEYREQQRARAAIRRSIEDVIAARRQRDELISIISPQLYETQKRLKQYKDAIAASTAKPGSQEMDWLIYGAGIELLQARQTEKLLMQLQNERDSYTLLGDKPPAPYVPDPRRALSDAQFFDAFAQSKDRLIAGPWAKSIEKYLARYPYSVDPFRRMKEHTPFDAFTERGQLERQFGRVNESPEAYERNAAFWRAEVERVKAQPNDETTPKEDVLRFLGR